MSYMHVALSCSFLCNDITISYKYPLMHTYIISTLSLRHVSALKGPSSGDMTDTFLQQYQQNMYQI